MWCWGRTAISWINHVKNVEVLHKVKVERNILHKLKRIKVKWIGLMLRKNCFSNPLIEGKIGGRIAVTGRRRRRSRKLLDGLEERSEYWKLKQEALNRALWRIRFKRDYGPVVRDYVMTMMVMIMMVTRHIQGQRLAMPGKRNYYSPCINQLRNMYVIIINNSLPCYAEGTSGEANIVTVGLS
jgi:hypothetical protein